MIWRKERKIELNTVDVNILRKYAKQSNPMEEILKCNIPNNLPPILTPHHLPLMIHNCASEYRFWEYYHEMMGFSNNPEEHYFRMEIPKSDGGVRVVYRVRSALANIQHWILRFILEELPISQHATAYAKGKKITDNAAPHVGQHVVVKADIKDFFGSVGFISVYHVFKSAGYSDNVSVLLANLCCCRGHLMQGACTSPALSNLCFRVIDDKISGFCAERDITYTRYSDDMTFSGNFAPGEVIIFLRDLLKAYGFTMNEKKTKVLRQHQRQIVTGAVVNSKMQPSKEYRRRIRQEMYYLRKFGLLEHLERNCGKYPTPIHYLESLYGKMNYVLQFDPDNAELIQWMREVDKILYSIF